MQVLQMRQYQPSNISKLLKTWIQDEGNVIDVLELCRDVLFIASYSNNKGY